MILTTEDYVQSRWFAQAAMRTAASVASTQNDGFFIFEFLLRWLR